MGAENTAVRTVYVSLFSNAALAGIKVVAGIFGNSYALIADAIESATDVFSSLLVLMGIRYAQRPADENHPYGHGRIEPLVTFIVVGFLMVSATVIAYESILNIQTPHTLPKPWTLIVLGLIIAWKEGSYHWVKRQALRTGNSSLIAEAWHHRSDAVTSVAAFIGITIALMAGPGFESADDWAALFASGFILYNCYKIFRPALGEVMDENLHDELIAQIRLHAMDVPGIIDTEKCFIRKTGNIYHVDLHATVDGNLSVREGHDLAHQLVDELKKSLPQLGHILVHIEPDDLIQ
jgi:cation diffusion facilitator family transporter